MFNGMKFETFTLGNKLEVLAISDDRFVKSSAALAVMAGSMQNPEEHLGLAHFLEHMLFLGTESFPQVGEYEDFLNKNGGGHNAYTSIDHTNYFFDVVHSGFEGALERFSRFFVCPTFDDKYVEREKNAVHSEHEKNLKEDGRREYRFQQVITDPNHPFSKFATGDKETLKNANRDIVMDFYKKHYSSNLMRLVLMSNKSSQNLVELANKYFADIPNTNLEMPVYEDRLFVADHKPQMHKVESIRDQDILKMSFDTPDDLPYWESKPTSFLAHLLGEEGEGSLLSYLKEEGLASGLETSTWWKMFHVRVTLTEKGKANYEDIIKSVFSYIELVKKEGLKEYLFNERKVLAEVDLDNIEPKSSMGRASNFSASMLYYPVDDFLKRYYLYHTYSPKEFNLFLEKLNPDNMQVTLLTKESVSENTEPYYGIGYSSQLLSEDLMRDLKDVEVYKELKYPEENPYLPTDLSLVCEKQVLPPCEENYKDFSTLFSQVDTELEIPRGSLSLSFISDVIGGDPKAYLVAKLFAKLKKEELNEWGYPARLAGLNYNISHGYNTITVEVNGFSQHLPHLLSDLLLDSKHGRRIDEVQVSQSVFERVKKNYKKLLANKDHDAAYQQLLYEVSYFFSSASVHRENYGPLIDEITLEDVNLFTKEFFKQVAIRSYSFGNIDADSVKPIIDSFFNNIGDKGFTESDVIRFENKYIQLPENSRLVLASGPNNNNAQVSFYKLSDWSIASQAHLDVLSKMIEQPYFTELRTHQQLGYVVAAFGSSSNGFSGLGTLIQTQNFQADDAFHRSNKFMFELLNDFKTSIKDEDVEAIKLAIIAEISQKPNSMGERLSRFTMMAGTYHGDFRFFERLVDEVKKVSAQSIKEMLEDFLLKDNANPNLCFVYNGSDGKEFKAMDGFNIIEDIHGFKEKSTKVQPYKYKKSGH